MCYGAFATLLASAGAAGGAGAGATFATAAGAIPATVAVTSAVPLGATVGATSALAGIGSGALLTKASLAATLASGVLGIAAATRGVNRPAPVIEDTSRAERLATDAALRERRQAQGFRSTVLGGLDTGAKPSLARQALLGTP